MKANSDLSGFYSILQITLNFVVLSYFGELLVRIYGHCRSGFANFA